MKAKPKTFPSKLNGESCGTLDNGGDKSGVALCESEGVGMKWVSGPPLPPRRGRWLPLPPQSQHGRPRMIPVAG